MHSRVEKVNGQDMGPDHVSWPLISVTRLTANASAKESGVHYSVHYHSDECPRGKLDFRTEIPMPRPWRCLYSWRMGDRRILKSARIQPLEMHSEIVPSGFLRLMLTMTLRELRELSMGNVIKRAGGLVEKAADRV